MVAAIYARKATEQRGADDEAKSVALQIQNARTFAAEKGWTVAEEHVYFDVSISGVDIRKLKARTRLLDVIAAGAPFQVLIVHEQSRFSRRDGGEAFTELKKIARAGVDIWFYKERTRFAFGTFGDNVVGFVRAEAAAGYRCQIASWTYEAMERKARAGQVTGGNHRGQSASRSRGSPIDKGGPVFVHCDLSRFNAPASVCVMVRVRAGASGTCRYFTCTL